MSNYKILNEQNQLIELSSSDLTQLLEQANLSTQEKNFSPHKIIDKLNSYLEIFLLNPQNNLSKNQLRDLITQIIKESNSPLTAELFQNIFGQFQPVSANENIQENTLLYPRAIQEKIKKIYTPFEKNSQDIEVLLEKIAQKNFPRQQFDLTEKIHQLILAKKFLPHQNILRGRLAFDEMNIAIDDDLDSIFDGLKQLAINFQNNVATTINFSRLRPKLSLIKSTLGVSSGPISFIKIFASAFEALRQNISSESTPVQTIILNIHHPDILEYLILIKNFEKNSINKNFLFLIELTPAFLEALAKGDDFELINPENQQTVNFLSSKNTFDLIVSSIQSNSQLGLIQESPAHSRNHLTISGFLNLAEYDSELGSNWKNLINDLQQIEKYLQNQQEFLSSHQSDHSGLPSSSNTANKLIDKNPIQIKINLTGFADLLIKLQIGQNSIQSLELSAQILGQIRQNLHPETQVSTSLISPILSLFESSRGLEVYDQLYFSKTNVDGQEISHPITPLKQILNQLGLNTSELISQIVQHNSLQPLYQIPAEIKNLFLTSKELPTEFHLNLQKTFEQQLGIPVDKKILFESGLELEQAKEILINYLQQNLRTVRFCSFEPLVPTSENNISANEKNFLLNKIKKRKHQQIQPPLFQIKKTEEILLPPIVQQKQIK